ncbi:F-box/LRR-repeat protein 4 [Aplysia californica]|uniref:F-box/LRR-repeat protein 4 n=1 Tax=Aplysia californica TaxID=6500 RepID=A0ABM0JYM2_APLCA|nr:F-box/LRR-repeat protein 4 [Aplysia californica]
MARNVEEYDAFLTDIMTSVQHYRDLDKKQKEEPSEADFLIRLEGQEVVDFSSQYGSESSISYVASNLAGKTFVFPSYGDYTQTCVFRTYGKWWKVAPSGRRKYLRTSSDFYGEDFIEVSFAEMLYPVRIEVYETYNPGAIIRILACDRAKGSDVDKGIRWVTLWSSKPKACKQRPRIFAPRLKKMNFATNLIRLELNHQYMDYYTELDGIKLVGTKTPPAPDLLRNHQVLPADIGDVEDSKDGDQVFDGPSSSARYSEERYGKTYNATADGIDELALSVDALSFSADSEEKSFFTQLPKELIHFILKYLDITDLCRLAQTCSLLRDHCYDPLLYIDLNLQPYWNLVSNASLDALSQRCERLQRLNLSWLGKGGLIYSDHLAYFLHDCQDLQTLELTACKIMDSNTLALIVSNCRNLQELNLSSCVNIEDFSTFNVLSLPKLRMLNLYRTKIDTPSLLALIRSSPDLEHLNLSSCMLLNPYINLVLMDLGDCCKKLKSLDLWRMRSVNSEGLAHLYNNCPLLEELDVGWCTDLKAYTQCFVQLAEKCVKLKKIFMTANRTVQDSDLKSLALHCPNLEQIDVLGTREVTRNGVLFVLEKCKNLIFLDLSFCLGIATEDVWAWRSLFPNVAIKKSFQHISIVH